MRNGDFDVVLEAPGHGMVNPLLDVQKALPATVDSENYGNYDDPQEVDLYDKMLHETDPARQRALMRQFEKLRAGRPGAHDLGAVVAPDRAVPVLCEGLQDRPDAFHQPGSGDRSGSTNENSGRKR